MAKRTKTELERAAISILNASLQACKSVAKSRWAHIRQIATGDWMESLDPNIGEFEALTLWDQQRASFLRECANPFELHLFAYGWNWDDGVGSIRKLIKNDACDAGTALMLYWTSDPEFYLDCRTISDYEYDKETLKISRFIEGKFKRGGFTSHSIPFDPAPWVTNKYDNFAVRKIPEIMFTPIVTTRIRKKK